MDFDPSPRVRALLARLEAFMSEQIYPAEARYREQLEAGGRWASPPVMETLKQRAREAGLWNLFLPDSEQGAGLNNLEYAPLCELMGRSPIAPEACNCSAPDTGNMEVLARYATPQQQQQWLVPLLAGEIRSAFAMTEPAVGSSDATNIAATIRRDGDAYVLDGRKWWTSGALDPRCRVLIFMGVSDPAAERHRRHSMILVPSDAPGVRVERALQVFGYDDAPHGHAEVSFDGVRVPAANMLLGEGRGFEIAQGRLGPGRIHHCMRLVGLAERALGQMVERVRARTVFGRTLAEHGVTLERLAESRVEIEQARLLTLRAADRMDKVGNRVARAEIAMIKLAAPRMALSVLDRAIQAFGGAGVSQDFPLAQMWAQARTLRIADGPDEVHARTIGRLELEPARE